MKPSKQVSDGRNINFWMTQNALVDDDHIARMGVNAWAIYCIILRRCNRSSHQAFPSFTDLEEKSGLSRPTVSKAIKTLIKMGYIVKLEKGNSHGISNTYEVADIAKVEASIEPPNTPKVVNDFNQLTDLTSKNFDAKVVNGFNSNKTKQKDSSFDQPDGADGVAVAPEKTNPPLEQNNFDLLAKIADLEVPINNGLKSRILHSPSSVVKIAISELQAGMAKGTVEKENHAKYLNGLITKNLELYNSTQQTEKEKPIATTKPPEKENTLSEWDYPEVDKSSSSLQIKTVTARIRKTLAGEATVEHPVHASSLGNLFPGSPIWVQDQDGVFHPSRFERVFLDEETKSISIATILIYDDYVGGSNRVVVPVDRIALPWNNSRANVFTPSDEE